MVSSRHVTILRIPITTLLIAFLLQPAHTLHTAVSPETPRDTRDAENVKNRAITTQNNQKKSQKKTQKKRAKPRTKPSDETLSIINTTPVAINVRFETTAGTTAIEPIQGSSSLTIAKKTGTAVLYAFEGTSTFPITPDMINNNQVVIRMPIAPTGPDIVPPESRVTTTTPAPKTAEITDAKAQLERDQKITTTAK
jgi:hypothetical protein